MAQKVNWKEEAALALGEKAADQQKADTDAVKANDEFINHVESALNKGPGGDSSGASGAAAPAARAEDVHLNCNG